MDGCVTTISQPTRPTQPAVPLLTHYMGYGRWKSWYSWLGLPGLAAALACVCRLHAVAGRPAALVSDESALEACIYDDELNKLTFFTFTFTFYLFSRPIVRDPTSRVWDWDVVSVPSVDVARVWSTCHGGRGTICIIVIGYGDGGPAACRVAGRGGGFEGTHGRHSVQSHHRANQATETGLLHRHLSELTIFF